MSELAECRSRIRLVAGSPPAGSGFASLFSSCLLCMYPPYFFHFRCSFLSLLLFTFFLRLSSFFFFCSLFASLSFVLFLSHCVRPIQNWIRERVRGASGHQEHPKAFPMGHMNRMLIVYMHSVRTVCKRSDYERARARKFPRICSMGAVGLLCANGNQK